MTLQQVASVPLCHNVATVQVNVCNVSSEMQFEPASLPTAVLTAGHDEILQQTIHLTNSGSMSTSVRIVAQCDENLR